MDKSIIKPIFFAIIRSSLLAGFGDLFVSQNPAEFYACHSLGWILVVHIPFGSMVKFQFLAHFPVDLFPYPVVFSPNFFLR